MAGSAGLVGLDLGTSGIRAVQLDRDRRTGEYSFARVAAVDLPVGAIRAGEVIDTALVIKALRTLWRRGRFSTRRVVFGLPDSGVLTRQLDLPWMRAPDFRAALRYQIGDALPVDLAAVQLDFHALDESRQEDGTGQLLDVNRILVVAANSAAVAATAKVLRRARLEPVAADTAAFALIRVACGGRLPDSQAVMAVADLGADQLTVVVHQSGQPRFIRTIGTLGGDVATAAVADRLNLGLGEAEALKRSTGLNGPPPVVALVPESSVFTTLAAEAPRPIAPQAAAAIDVLNPWATSVIAEIRNSLDYFEASEPGPRVTALSVAGRSISLPGLMERISTQIPLPVRALPPLLDLGASRRVARLPLPDARLAVAAGLAMHPRGAP